MSLKNFADKKIAGLESAVSSFGYNLLDYSCISIRTAYRIRASEEERELMETEAYFYKRLKVTPYNSSFFGQHSLDLFTKVTRDVRDAERWLAKEFKRSQHSVRKKSIRESRLACRAAWIARKNFRREILGKHTIDGSFSESPSSETEAVYQAATEVMKGILGSTDTNVTKYQREIEGYALNFSLAWGLPKPTRLVTWHSRFHDLYDRFAAKHGGLAQRYEFSTRVELPTIVCLGQTGKDQGDHNGRSDPAAARSLMVFE
jgi:hypothetical protein